MKKITSLLALSCLFAATTTAMAAPEGEQSGVEATEIVGTPFRISAGGGCDLPLPEGTPVTYNFSGQWAGISAAPGAFTVEEYDEVVIKFAEAPACYYNVPFKDANGTQQWNAVGDQNGKTEWHIAITQNISELGIQNVEKNPTSLTITDSYAVKKDGSKETIKWTWVWGVSTTVDADITSGTATLTGLYGGVNISNDIIGKEGRKILRIYTDDETDLNGFPIQWCIRTAEGADAWPQIGVVNAHYAECNIDDNLQSIFLQYTAENATWKLGIKAITWELIDGDVPTAVSSIATQNMKNGKFMKDGKIVIMKNGKAYNVMGIQQ